MKQSVNAQGEVAQIGMRSVGPETSIIVYYPGRKKAYVYADPFVGAPTASCAYSFELSEPGGTITRGQCRDPESR